jgi:O-antigen/teichoic acid export membrane protein
VRKPKDNKKSVKKLDKIEIFKNVGSSWFSLGLNVLVGLFISPYILHRLGDAAFGLWVLVFSITGYYGLFDLGIRSSIVRYVAKYSANSENDELNRLVNTALFSYSGIGATALLLTFVGSVYVDSIFRVPADFHNTARLLLLMVGTAVSLGFPLGVFGGILEGLQRFYVLNFTNVCSTLIRALLIVIALQHGKGLLTVALITVTLPLLGNLVNGTIVLRILPLHFHPRYLNRSSFKRIASYSGPTFMIIIASRLRFKTDAMVIGTFLSSAAITYFAIGSRLVDYMGEVVSSLAQIFIPMSSQSDAIGDSEQLKKIFIAGNRACALIVLPIAASLVILGKSVIEVWVGARYIATSYPVLLMLVIPTATMLAQSACGRVLFGMAKHRILALAILLEGITNLILSIVLVRPFGILGDAAGTAIPLLCTTLFFLPRHTCRILGVRVWTYVREAFLLPLILCIPLVAVLLLTRDRFAAHTLVQLASEVSICWSVYGLELLWAHRAGRLWRVQGVRDEGHPEGAVAAVIETYQEQDNLVG